METAQVNIRLVSTRPDGYNKDGSKKQNVIMNETARELKGSMALQEALTEVHKGGDTIMCFVTADAESVRAINTALKPLLYDLKPTQRNGKYLLSRAKGSGKPAEMQEVSLEGLSL